MCTAISLFGDGHLFGRTLDLEYSYGESVVITPCEHPYHLRHEGVLSRHLAIIGTAYVKDGAPLYYDGMNEAGLAIAALNFPGKAVYRKARSDMRNIASFEVIPWVLSQCENVTDAVELLKDTNITDDEFDRALPSAPLHWIIADKECAVTVEPLGRGLDICDNHLGVLTNNPEFSYHMTNTSNYMSLSPIPPENHLCPDVKLDHYSRGMGAIGLPGDFSSSSRFVRAVYAKNNTRVDMSDRISGFFHIMDTVSQPSGCAVSDEGKPIMTVYTSCADTERGIYYFTTYSNRRIRAARIAEDSTDSRSLICYPMSGGEDIEYLTPHK